MYDSHELPSKGARNLISYNNLRRAPGYPGLRREACQDIKAQEIPVAPLVRLVVVLAVEDAQNRQKQIQDIQIQRNSGGNLLLNVVVAHNKLSIYQDVAREDQRTQHTVDQLGGAAEWHEHGHETEKDHEPQRAEEVGHPAGKVILGLAREQRKRDEDTQGQDECLHDNPRLVERRHNTDGVCLHQRESGEEQQVRWVGLALPVGCEHEAEGAKDRDDHEPEVALDPVAV